jgi:hypothetical protein
LCCKINQKEEGRRKKEEGRRKREEGRGKRVLSMIFLAASSIK